MSPLERIREDIRSILDRDPAARSILEVLTCYPGLWAVWIYRVSHMLWCNQLRLLARIVSQVSRFFTGVDIHPGARLGRRLFIDHASGVVIGETAIVGNDVTLYQGVTLGGTGKERGKRHPTLCDNVFVGNNANILGNITVGANSRVGAGSVVLTDVPPNSTIVGVPGHLVYRNGKRVLITNPREIKDPLSDALLLLSERLDHLDGRLRAVESSHNTWVSSDMDYASTRKPDLAVSCVSVPWANNAEPALLRQGTPLHSFSTHSIPPQEAGID